MSTALIHDWFSTYAGSEKVIEQILHVLPDAELHALVDFLPEGERGFIGNRKVATSFIQRLPFAKKHFRNYLMLMPYAIEQFDLSRYDTILSSNHAFAKGVITASDQLHISYVHTPIRYAWDLQHEYLNQAGLTRGLKSMFIRRVLHRIRLWDRLAADRVDLFVCNSAYIAQRLWRTYRRPATVIYPPVDVDKFPLQRQKADYYITASRMVPYKRMDLIVETFAKLPNKKLVVIGDGPEMKKIKKLATPNIELLGYQENQVLIEKMQHARAFVFAADEDFGIMPVEAQATGTPVIAYGRGGSLETVVPGVTGEFFAEQTVTSLTAAIEQFEKQSGRYEPDQIRAHAERFSIARFRQEYAELVQSAKESFARADHETWEQDFINEDRARRGISIWSKAAIDTYTQ
jgi:glycosyltransferase involved in cell wall biosynthesis